MVIASTGQVSFTDIQNEFGGENPIGMDEYYQNASNGRAAGVSGIPNIGSEIKLSHFRGKSKPPKFISIQSNIFSAPGAPGQYRNYSSANVTIPSDYDSTVSWNLKLYCVKEWSNYNFVYAYMAIHNTANQQIAVTAINGSYHSWHVINRSWNNRTNHLGNAGDQIKFNVSFFTFANLSNVRFTLELTYNAK